jgi:prepilin-type N-terminal cleavage/methylation domain-containing protein
VRSPGFTLLELIVAVALASVATGLGVTRTVDLVQALRVSGAARSLATMMRLARARALAGGAGVELRLDVAGAAAEMRDLTGRTLEVRRLPRGVALTALPARSRVLFGALGSAENGTVSVGAGTRVRSVVVNQRGRVRVQ